MAPFSFIYEFYFLMRQDKVKLFGKNWSIAKRDTIQFPLCSEKGYKS